MNIEKLTVKKTRDILIVVAALIGVNYGTAVLGQQVNPPVARMNSFPLSAVRLLEGPFLQAQQTDLEYIMSLDPDRLLSPYLREAGLTPKKESYGNWENTGLDGHTGGHYLTALSLMYASTGNPQVLERLQYMLSELKKCQEKIGNGYIGGVPGGTAMWNDIAAGRIDAGAFSLNKKWVPWYNIHKLYAGLRDAYLFTGNGDAKKMLIGLSEWGLKLLSNLSNEQIQLMLKTEHGGMNEVFADVAVITGNKAYLELAKKFSDRTILNPLARQQDQLNGLHANTQIPKVIGFEQIAKLTGDSVYRTAARFFWETVVHHRTSVIGGNSVREHFHPSSDFSPMITDVQGPETCNSYNMLKLSKMLFEAEGNSEYLDYYERTLYNHILSSQNPRQGGFVYFTPLRPNHYRVYSSAQENFWCCVGSGMENHAKYGELIYSHTKDDLYINLFIASTLNWNEKGITVTQQTKFPFKNDTEISIDGKPRSAFSINLRYPAWVKPGSLKVRVNGVEQKINKSPGSYVSIHRNWKAGDKISVVMPMSTTIEEIPDKSGFVAVLHGPVVLAAKTGSSDMAGLFADGSRMGHVASGELIPLQKTPLLLGNLTSLASGITLSDPETLTFNAQSVIYPASYTHLELIPFFMLHSSRYIVYWPWATRATLDARMAKLEAIDRSTEHLASVTVDQVSPGEQQPESDHFFEGEDTQTGLFKERHYRKAKGWFSYKLINRNRRGKRLEVTYFGKDNTKGFDIFINNVRVKPLNDLSSQEESFYTADYQIPDAVLNNAEDNVLVVKFSAHEQREVSRIFDLRLVRR